MKNIYLALLFLTCIFLGAQQMVQTSTKWSDFVSLEGDSWKVRFTDRKTVETIYGISKRKADRPENAAAEFLQRHHHLFGIDRLAALRLFQKTIDSLGSHFLYQQYYSNLPVEGAVVSIHMNPSNQVIAANSSFQSNLRPARGSIRSAELARFSAVRFLGKKSNASAAKLVVLPLAGEAVQAWKIHVDPADSSHGSMLLYIDAVRTHIILRALKTHTAATGEGRIYMENPIVTPERSNQPFLYLHGEKLNGKFLRTYNANDQNDVNEFRFSEFTTASDPAMQYNFRERDLRLAEAMAYFHINRVHDRWKQLGMTVLNAKAPVIVNVTEADGGRGLDNAFYTRIDQFPNTGAYVFGSGDQLENLGLDADIYYHEYGHGVLDQTRPQFLEAFENNYPRAFHEGFSDVSAAAITGNSKIGEYGLRVRDTKEFVGRDLENNNRFPQDVIHPALKRSEIHHTGLIAGGAWWDLQKSLGTETAQQILYKALPLLPKEMTFFDLRDSMIVTDSVFNQGRNQQAIENSFAEHGIAGADPRQTGTLNITALRTGLYDLESGRVRLTNRFQSGDVIAVLADYVAKDVMPAYNMIPEWIDLQGPPSGEFLIGFFADEVVKGRHGGLKGALQLLILSGNPGKGTFKVFLRSRLGGTSRLLPKRNVSFTMN